MQQAIERVTKSIETYRDGTLSKSLARIELVSSFTVVSKSLGVAPEALQELVGGYVDKLLTRLDDDSLTTQDAITELTRVYEAAHNDEASILAHMADY